MRRLEDSKQLRFLVAAPRSFMNRNVLICDIC